MSQRIWTVILILLFISSMLCYPTYTGTVKGWPVNFLLTVGICLIYAILYGFYIQDRLNRED
jgi:hypothetical protein